MQDNAVTNNNISKKSVLIPASIGGAVVGGFAGYGGGAAVTAFIATGNAIQQSETSLNTLAVSLGGGTTTTLMGVSVAVCSALLGLFTKAMVVSAVEKNEAAISQDTANNVFIAAMVATTIVSASVTTAQLDGSERVYTNQGFAKVSNATSLRP